MVANGDADRIGGVRARRAAALLPAVEGDGEMFKTFGDDDRARTMGITLDRYDMVENEIVDDVVYGCLLFSSYQPLAFALRARVTTGAAV